MRSSILTIPVELRLQIYSYLHAPALELNLCKGQSETRLLNCSSKNRQSPLLTYLHKRRALAQWAREYGVHLLATNVILAQEYSELIKRSSILTIHCTKCLTKLLIHLRNDLGLKRPVFKNIRTQVDFCPGSRSPALWRRRNLYNDAILDDAFAAFQRVMIRMYGASSLSYDELNHSSLQDPDRKWLFERVRFVGILPEGIRVSEDESEDDESVHLSSHDSMIIQKSLEESDENEDLMFTHHHWGHYNIWENVRELNKWSLQWHVGDPDGELLRRIKRRIRMSEFTSVNNEWRPISIKLFNTSSFYA